MLHDGSGLLLFAAIGGYWVLERAESHKGGLRKIGRLLGGAIILISLIGIACRVWYAVSCAVPGMKGGYCPMTYHSSGPASTP